jgi:squalene cyclase
VLLDLDGAITSIVDLSVSTTSNLGADVTTTGTQTYTGAATLSGAARTLTTTGDTVTFVKYC